MRIAIESPKTSTEQDVEENLHIWNRKPRRFETEHTHTHTHTTQADVQLFSECFVKLSIAHLNVCTVLQYRSDARYNSNAFATVYNLVHFRAQTRVSSFASTCKLICFLV